MKRRRLLALVALAALAGALAFFALRSSSYLQTVPWLPRFIGRWADAYGVGRNVVAFFALGLAYFPLISHRIGHVVALCAFATLLEVAQLWIPTRQFDWRDIVASVAGILAAWPPALWLARRRSA